MPFLREASGGPTYSTCSSFSSPSFTATASVLLLPLLGSFFDIPPTDDRETGGCDEFRPNGQLKPIFRRLAYGLLGFAKSVTVETSAREEKDRDLPPKNFDNPGLLQNKDKKKPLSEYAIAFKERKEMTCTTNVHKASNHDHMSVHLSYKPGDMIIHHTSSSNTSHNRFQMYPKGFHYSLHILDHIPTTGSQERSSTLATYPRDIQQWTVYTLSHVTHIKTMYTKANSHVIILKGERHGVVAYLIGRELSRSAISLRGPRRADCASDVSPDDTSSEVHELSSLPLQMEDEDSEEYSRSSMASITGPHDGGIPEDTKETCPTTPGLLFCTLTTFRARSEGKLGCNKFP